MPSLKHLLREEYNRLKKVFDKLTDPRKQRVTPQPAWQPIRNKKRF